MQIQDIDFIEGFLTATKMNDTERYFTENHDDDLVGVIATNGTITIDGVVYRVDYFDDSKMFTGDNRHITVYAVSNANETRYIMVEHDYVDDYAGSRVVNATEVFPE